MKKVDTKSMIKYNDGGVRMRGIPKGRYTKELREEAVKLVTEGNMALIEAARRLSLPISTLGNWVKAYRAG
ncbi:MAG: transposase, partial [Deltaproteobacteria bacterium]|nr:transposase [Deltaproteobacteria bacterium]